MAERTDDSLTDAEVTELWRIAGRQAAIVAPRYSLDVDDVIQEIWVWALSEGAGQIRRYLDAGHLGRVAKTFYSAAVRHGERDKRAGLGYDWRDDYNYSRPEVARLLPLALDPGSIPGLQGSALHDGPSARSDPAYGGGMLAAVVDVRVAFGKLSESDREFVKAVVGLDAKWDAVAVHTGMKSTSAQSKYYRILDRMVTRHLGRAVDDDAA